VKYETRIALAMACACLAVIVAGHGDQIHTMRDFKVVRVLGVLGWLTQAYCWLRAGCTFTYTEGSKP